MGLTIRPQSTAKGTRWVQVTVYEKYMLVTRLVYNNKVLWTPGTEIKITDDELPLICNAQYDVRISVIDRLDGG